MKTELLEFEITIAESRSTENVSIKSMYRPISQTVFMLSIAINRAKTPICDTVIIKHNYMLMCNQKMS